MGYGNIINQLTLLVHIAGPLFSLFTFPHINIDVVSAANGPTGVLCCEQHFPVLVFKGVGGFNLNQRPQWDKAVVDCG